MTVENIALVRAMDYIPFDGILYPICHVPYLRKSDNEFNFKIYDLLNEIGILPKIDPKRWQEEGYYEKMTSELSNIAKEYYPYNSDYNSMILFSLNGICPDDSEHGFGNNTFSNKKVAVIEPLKYHIDQTISLVPTDTSLKGDVILSSEAVLLIEEELYNSLSLKQKEILNNNYFTIKIFTGSLKEAIKNELKLSGKYTAEDLSLSSSTGGVKDSATSEELKSCIKNIANQNNLLQMKFFDILQTRDESLPKYSEFCDEVKNIMVVNKYFLRLFLVELVTNFLNKPDMADYVFENCDYGFCLNEVATLLKEKIAEVGIEEYKNFVDKYNNKLLLQQINNTLPTPEEIVSNSKVKIFNN